jgi:c-di-GMP-binding flagellar brake protein YcgR
MEEINPADRRQHPRTPLDLDIEVSQVLAEGAQDVENIIRCKCRDISGGGISFYSMHPYASQSVLRLHIPLDHTHIKVMGKVTWGKQLPTDPTFVTGVQFLNIYEHDFEVLCSYIMTKCL